MFRRAIVIDDVLVELPRGKKYANGAIKPIQKAQKGLTCWYYTLNNLRERYGKFFPEEHPGRKNELIFSDYRKAITRVGQIKKIYTKIISTFVDHPIDKKQVRDRIELTIDQLDRNIKPGEIELYESFLAQTNFNSLKDYVEYIIRKKQADACLLTFKKLKINPETALKEYFLKANMQKSIENLTLSQKVSFYPTLIRLIATQTYGIRESDWHPIKNGIEGLIKILRDRGACKVSGILGKAAHTKAAHKQRNLFYGHEVYGWDANEAKVGWTRSHSILIVGAQQIGEKGYVYYVDPDDAHSISAPPLLYVMTYTKLVKNITNIYGFSFYQGCKNSEGPFAFQLERSRVKCG